MPYESDYPSFQKEDIHPQLNGSDARTWEQASSANFGLMKPQSDADSASSNLLSCPNDGVKQVPFAGS